jgi:hypothetical protein
LEPFILGNKIPELPAETISKIFGVYAREKEFLKIEKMIVSHIKLASLDFQQVRTCRKKNSEKLWLLNFFIFYHLP